MSARCAQLSSPTLGRSPQCFRQAAALDRVVGGSGYLAEVDAPGLHRPHVVRLTCSLLNEFPTTGMRLDLLWEAPAEGLIQLRGAGLADSCGLVRGSLVNREMTSALVRTRPGQPDRLRARPTSCCLVRSPMSDFGMAPRATLLSRRSLLALTACGALTAGLPGCALPTRLAAVPRGRASTATVLNVPNERFFPTEATGQAVLQREFVEAVQRQLVSRGLPPTTPLLELDLLGISGGGENGAFGAGLLNGWTERGDRPTFFLVTGISTGALSAPFAFLGSTHDAN